MGGHFDIHKIWKAVEFVSHPPAFADHPAVRELDRIYGEAVTAEFSLADPRHWEAYQQSMWRPQWDFTARLLDSAAFAEALPMLAGRRGEPGFYKLGAFMLAGSIAETLHRGGAYSRTEDVAHAEDLGRSLVYALLADRREGVVVLAAEDAWHEWFADVAWDRTWIVLDWEQRRIHFLAATSTD